MSSDFLVGDCIVRPQRRIVERGDESIHLKPKSMSVLECLVAAAGAPVSRNDLFDTVWPGGEVSDDTLTQCIVELRKALGDTARESRVIETIPKLGFRLVPPVQRLEQAQSPANNRESSRANWHRPGSARFLLIAFLLVLVASLSFTGSRLWLTEKGIGLLTKTAALLPPRRLEPINGIAVLPFVNMSGDPDNEYFSDGMSAEILNALGHAARLPVIARSSSFQFKGQQRDIKEVGRLLGVTHVLEGSVRKVDNNIRMTVHLIDTATGGMVWSGAYQRELKDIFTLQKDIAENIVEHIHLALGDIDAPPHATLPAPDHMTARNTANPEAYDLYLKGIEMLNSNRPARIEQAPGYFDQAIGLDANYADAWAAKGLALATLGWGGSGSSRIPASVYPDAIAALRRALEIEPGHAFAKGWLGVVLMENDFKWAEGMRLLEESVARNPNDAVLLTTYGFYMELMHLEGAEEVLDRAYRLDPFNIETIMNRAIHLKRQGRSADAVLMMDTTLIGDPEGYTPNYFSAQFNMILGRLDVAEERIKKARLVANPVDLNLDVLQWLIDSRRGKAPFPCALAWQRMQTEHLSGAVLSDECADEKTIVNVFDLAIRQRHPELRSVLFGPKPSTMPEAEWRRIKDITGVTQFQSTM